MSDTNGLAFLLSEAKGGPWSPEPDAYEWRDGPDEVYLTNEQGDSLHVTAEDVAALINFALSLHPDRSDAEIEQAIARYQEQAR